MQPVKFMYKNHRGEISNRTVVPDAIEFLFRPGFNYQPGWFLSGMDQDKMERRSFALCNIIVEYENTNWFTLDLK